MTKYENPAAQFFADLATHTTPEPEGTQSTQPREIPEGYKLDPRYIEIKSRKLQLLLQPSLYAEIKTLADLEGQSVNNYIHTILRDYVEGLKNE